jgi:hypothetical protein
MPAALGMLPAAGGNVCIPVGIILIAKGIPPTLELSVLTN